MDSFDRLLTIFPTARTDQEYAQTFLWYHLRRYPDKKTANIKEIQDYFRQADRPIPSIEFIRHAFLPHPTFRGGSANDTFGINEGPGTGIKWFDRKFGPCFIEEPGPPDDGLRSATQSVLPFSVVCNTRGYIERVANQVNGTYENGWYDACTVMVRRLFETLIIEAFEHHNQEDRRGVFFLKDLIDNCLQQSAWNLSLNCKLAMPKLKDIGDKSAIVEDTTHTVAISPHCWRTSVWLYRSSAISRDSSRRPKQRLEHMNKESSGLSRKG